MKLKVIFSLIIASFQLGCADNGIQHFVSAKTINRTEYRIDYGMQNEEINFLVLSVSDNETLDPSNWLKIHSGLINGMPFTRAKLVLKDETINLVNCYRTFEVVNGECSKIVRKVPTKENLMKFIESNELWRIEKLSFGN